VSNCLFIHGDARKLPIDPKLIDAIVSDPPYGLLACDLNWGKFRGKREWDKEPATNVECLIDGVARAVIWGGNYFRLPPSRGWLVWYKRDAVQSMANCELAWTNIDQNTQLFDWPIAARNFERVGHPAQKPIALMRWCIQKLKLKPNSLIVDPYCGSGSTAIAAEQEGHRFIGLDLDRDYLKIAKHRIDHPNRHIPRPGRVEHHPLFDRLEEPV